MFTIVYYNNYDHHGQLTVENYQGSIYLGFGCVCVCVCVCVGGGGGGGGRGGSCEIIMLALCNYVE